MRTVGLTGNIACGKSTVADLLRARGVPVLDLDQVARAVLAPGTEGLTEVVHRFGDPVLLPDGALNRQALGDIVMNDETARKGLEAITHPRIFVATQQWLEKQEKAGHETAVVEAALLVETGSWRMYDALLVVACTPEQQLDRLRARDGFEPSVAEKWMASQLAIEEKVALATAVVWNDGPIETLANKVDQAWARITA
jgi:dephospho-CoA kinase